jgi:tetratricopeptide (TPR) repeat protein
MRRALALLLSLACVKARPVEQQKWSELTSEHFVLRTDLDEPAAREALTQLELVRSALIGVAWHAKNPLQTRLLVIDLASEAELREFAGEGIDGFAATDAFGEPMIVMSADQPPEQLTTLKHELAHAVSNEFLARNPRWVAEGIACYLETLRFDGAAHTVVVGEPSRERLAFLARFPLGDVGAVFATGSEAVSLSPEAGFAYETDAWVIVHFLANARRDRFDAFLTRLARAEDPAKAYAAEFPDLQPAALQAQIERYVKDGQYVRYTAKEPAPPAPAAIAPLPRSEVHALRADLLRISPGRPPSPEREAKMQSELALSLQDDPGNPLALELSQEAPADAATRAHPDDWRAWLVYAQRHDNDGAALAKAAKLAPGNALVFALLAWAENAAGRRKQAIEDARRANELSPGRSMHLDTLASLLAGAGKCGEAIATERRAIEALPDTAPAAFAGELRARLTQMELRCGRTPTHLEMAQEERPDTEPVRKSCSAPLGVAGPVTVTAEYTVREDGSVGDVSVTGKAPQAVLHAFRSFLRSCSYEPATKDGKPVPARMRQDLTVGKR